MGPGAERPAGGGVLVTGIAGDLGQAIAKALRLAPVAYAIAGCDAAPDLGETSAGLFCEELRSVPRADDPGYPAAVAELVDSLGVRVLVPGSEPDLAALAELGETLPCTLLAPESAWLGIWSDKLRAMETISRKVELAPFADGGDPAAVERLLGEAGLPLVVKPRRSSGSREIALAGDREQLDAALARIADAVVQGFIEGEEREYSVGVFRVEGCERAISFRRRLPRSAGGGGLSMFAELDPLAAVTEYALAVAAAAGLDGCANVQLRIGPAGPRLLEVNPRLSSLVAARAACGFHDAHWWIQHRSGEPIDSYEPRSGPFRFQRYFAEAIDAGAGYRTPPEWRPGPASA